MSPRVWTRWFPWRRLVSRVARSSGFIDPIPVGERLERLSRPSEVNAPVELLRAGAVFHARGLVNARTIQYLLDWGWPWWVQRQYDPRDEAFLPRAFALTHVNLTHRNWTAVGFPDLDRHPLVDPRGMVTPLYDGWSLDAWLVGADGDLLLPAEAPDADQDLVLDSGAPGFSGLEVRTSVSGTAGRLTTRADVVSGADPRVRIRVHAEGSGPGWLALALRPANPEGVASIRRVERIGAAALRVDDVTDVAFASPPDAVLLSSHEEGDVLRMLPPAAGGDGPARAGEEAPRAVECPVGLATAAALFPLGPGNETEMSVRIPLATGSDREPGDDVGRVAGGDPEALHVRPTDRDADDATAAASAWRRALDGSADLRTPDARFRSLYDAALRSLVLHAPGDVYPGPYTYKRFWFRDAALILDALCSVGLTGRARRVLDRYPSRQERSGYFRSQEGEWDSNGAALWAMDRYLRLEGESLPPAWRDSVERGARWIARKRVSPDLDAPHAGLLPAGFSAEHLGPNDHYYWDALWSVAGLRAAARMLGVPDSGASSASRWVAEADDLLACVDRSVARSPGHGEEGGVPASPYRRMDAGAVGSLVAGYPLRLWAPDDPRLLATAEHLLDHHMVRGGFFQDMIHSGINAYLTLHLAQVLLRAGDPRQEALVRAVAGLASPTGQWPEAVHPRTGGGCMGDGQHVWASAEWALMMRNWFVREEDGVLVLASGVPSGWLEGGDTVSFGPTPTPYGPITVRIRGDGEEAVVEWSSHWRGSPPVVDVRLPGHGPVRTRPGETRVRVDRARDGGHGPRSP